MRIGTETEMAARTPAQAAHKNNFSVNYNNTPQRLQKV